MAMGEIDTVSISLPGDGQVWNVGGRLTCKVSSASAGGAYTILEFRLPPGGGAPLHIHQREDEIMYLLEGECTFGFSGQEYRAPAGSTVRLPKGLAHYFRNDGADECRLLITAVPGGLDEYFAEVSAAIGRGQPEAIAEINHRYEIDFSPPAGG